MSGFFIGIDVGGTNLKAGLTDETGRLLAAARRRTCAAHGARAGHGRISVRPRLLHAGRSLSPALGRDTHVRRMPCGTARTASLVDISVLRLHAHPPFFAIF